MIRNRTWSLTLLCLVFTMILAACGGAPAATPTTAPAAAGATAAPAAADATAAPAAAEPTAAPAAAEPTAAAEPVAGATLNGITLPDDAAPADQQVLVFHYDNTADFTTIDFFESVYKRGGSITDILSDPLVRLDKNFKTVPGAATKWEVDATGLVWSFHLDPSLVWSDDTPVTADDYVATFQYAADPKHAWDFTWFFQGTIKNWTEVVAGTTPIDQLGVKAADANTFQVTTASPAPYLPAMMLYSNPMQKKALDAHGGLYNSDLATTVSSGPFILKDWIKGDRLIYEANPKYKGNNKPYIQKIVVIGAAPSTDFASYQAGEIDFVAGSNLSPADNEIIGADPELQKETHPQPNDFRTDYLFFDTQNPPFNDIKVRQAFAHVVDRDG
ncbi:MAG: ABC transporter substrate-binding protein, partial [Roseiflexaceae bacterium]